VGFKNSYDVQIQREGLVTEEENVSFKMETTVLPREMDLTFINRQY